MESTFGALLPSAAGMAWLLSVSAKAALLLAASAIGALCLRRATAATRHQIWTLGVAGALLLPLLAWSLPSLPLPVGAPATETGRAVQATVLFVTGGRGAGAAPEWPAWLAIAWAAGSLAVSLRFLRAHFAARRLSRAAGPARAETWSPALREAAASLGLARSVSLCRSETISTPMTIGLVRPRVLLPAAADAWSPARLRAVLLHELGHVSRRDTLIQLIAQLACVFYWWNPLAWLAAARLRIEREHACDDLVLSAGIRPSSYAADLLEVARGRSPDAAQAGAISMVDRSWTEGRLRRILDPATRRRPLGAWFRLAARGTTLAFAATLACTSSTLVPPAPRAPAAVEVASAVSEGPVWYGRPAVDPDVPTPLRVGDNASETAVVEKEIQRNAGDLERCYQRRLQVRPYLEGMVVMRWTITAGMVAEHSVKLDTLEDEEVLSCLKRTIEASHFPVFPEGPVEVSFPFFFGTPPPPHDDGC